MVVWSGGPNGAGTNGGKGGANTGGGGGGYQHGTQDAPHQPQVMVLDMESLVLYHSLTNLNN